MSSRFSFRSFTTFILAWTFVTLILSGVILYVSPPGRVAHWSNWTLGSLAKEGWQSVHVLMALLFLVGGFFHLLKFNWKVFVHYFKRRTSGAHYRTEAALSVGLFVLFLGGSLYGLPPFVWVITWGETVKSSWESPELAPPAPHFELETLERAAQSVGLDPSLAVQLLRDRRVNVESSNQTLKSISDANRLSPQDLYRELLAASRLKPVQTLNGPGLGWRTLDQVSSQMGVPVSVLIAKLADRGFAATADQTMKDVADSLYMSPHDLLATFQN